MKWQGAFFMPEHVKNLVDLGTDYHRQAKPQLDEDQFEEFDLLISEAMSFNRPVKVTSWANGFTSEVCGNVHYVDPLTQQLRIEIAPGEFRRVQFADIVGVMVAD
jgi:hypothetical protein